MIEEAEGKAALPQKAYLAKRHEGKLSESTGPDGQPQQLPAQPQPERCPRCGADKLCRSGTRPSYNSSSVITIQRWLCKSCGFRFSESIANLEEKVDITGQSAKQLNSREHFLKSKVFLSKSSIEPLVENSSLKIREDVASHNSSRQTIAGKGLNVLLDYSRECRVCASAKAKNLENQTKQESASVGATNETTQDIKGRIVQYAFWMEKQGYSKETIRGNMGCIRALLNRNSQLLDPESVKAVLAKEQKWSPNRRRNIINTYNGFLKLNGIAWEKPKCHVTRKFPFIPTEAELNSLISGCGVKTSTFLMLLKETAMRSGEAKRLEWSNIDSEKNLITLNEPEKRSNPRMWKVSTELIAMLNMLPKKSVRVFGDGPINSMKSTFIKTRKRLASKLQNPRLLNISFHTFRHWKATMLYHKTHDPYYVKDFLGHKCLSNTEIYINIEHTLFEDQSDEFTVKVAEKPEDIKALLEAGFEYVCQKDSLAYLRKRK